MSFYRAVSSYQPVFPMRQNISYYFVLLLRVRGPVRDIHSFLDSRHLFTSDDAM